jgi:hypothetical protein
MRESAQFASVVRSVLKFRVLKRVQEEMTRDELEKKRATLEQLERSEAEAKRIEQYMSSSGMGATPRRSASSASHSERSRQPREEDNNSVDSDFPPNTRSSSVPTAQQGEPGYDDYPSSPPPANGSHKRATSGVANKLFGRLTHAIQGVTDADPERARRDALGKTKESLSHLGEALEVSKKDVTDASTGVMEELRRFQGEKEEDLNAYMVSHQELCSKLAPSIIANVLHSSTSLAHTSNGVSAVCTSGRMLRGRLRRLKCDDRTMNARDLREKRTNYQVVVCNKQITH